MEVKSYDIDRETGIKRERNGREREGKKRE